MQQTVFVIGATYGDVGEKLRIVHDYIMNEYDILRVWTMDGKANGTVPIYAEKSLVLISLMKEKQCKEVIATIERIVSETKIENGENFRTLLVAVET
jgi:hypothetical protein